MSGAQSATNSSKNALKVNSLTAAYDTRSGPPSNLNQPAGFYPGAGSAGRPVSAAFNAKVLQISRVTDEAAANQAKAALNPAKMFSAQLADFNPAKAFSAQLAG
jgi:hypothetical protein